MTTAPSSAPDTAAAALTRAAQAWQAGAWGQVIALLTPWVDATPPAPEALQLIAMAHLAYPNDFASAGFAEFGVSVAKHARGRGYGKRLFERAAIHAVNDGVQTLYIHALSENTAMLRIARQAGAVVEHAGSESQAHLSLPPATFASRVSELLADQVGQGDFGLKTAASQARQLLATVQEVRAAVRDGQHRSDL